MARTAIRLAVAASVVWLSGCGTLMNVGTPSKENKVYGGVRHDIQTLCSRPGIFEHCKDVEDVCWNLMGTVLILGVDLPLCAALDTLTLPITVSAAIEKPAEKPIPSLRGTKPPTAAELGFYEGDRPGEYRVFPRVAPTPKPDTSAPQPGSPQLPEPLR